MTSKNAKIAEQLWLRAHESIRCGELANAVRDLAKAFEILKALQDPRLAQVHARWVDVHRMYKEESSGGGARVAVKAEAPRTLQAQAEAAANDGDLAKAIALYERIVSESPQNELARERLTELRQATARAEALSRPASPAVSTPVVERVVEHAAPVVERVAPVVERVVEQAAPVVEHAAPVVERVAPVVERVAEQAAPVVERVAEQAAPVVERVVEQVVATAPVVERVVEQVDDVGFLEALLSQVQSRRESRAH